MADQMTVQNGLEETLNLEIIRAHFASVIDVHMCCTERLMAGGICTSLWMACTHMRRRGSDVCNYIRVKEGRSENTCQSKKRGSSISPLQRLVARMLGDNLDFGLATVSPC